MEPRRRTRRRIVTTVVVGVLGTFAASVVLSKEQSQAIFIAFLLAMVSVGPLIVYLLWRRDNS
jgi:hypothetical protein